VDWVGSQCFFFIFGVLWIFEKTIGGMVREDYWRR